MKKHSTLAAICSYTSIEMRNLSLALSLALLMCGNVTKAQQFGVPSKGQFLETGYGTASNEKAFDLAISDNGLVMAGYVDSSETGRFLSIWQTDSLGHVLWHYKQEDVTQSYARSIAYKPTTSMLLSAGAIAPNFSWNEVLRDEDQLFVAAVSSSGDFAWSYTHTTTDTSSAAVDVLPTPTGFAVLANFLPDYSTYSQPYIVFLTDSGTLQGILPLGRNDKTLLAFKMQLNPADSSLVVAANEYLTSGKVIPTLYTINKTGTTYKSFSYTADDYCEIHSLAQDPTGNWWLAGESYSSGDTLATVIKTNYAYAKQATFTYSYTTGYSNFNDIIAHSEGLLATGIIESTGTFGEGYRDVLLQHLAFSGDSTLAETLGGTAHDEGHSLVLVPDQPIAFGVGYDNSYGIEESGNAYLFVVKVGAVESQNCEITRVLLVDGMVEINSLGQINTSLGILNHTTEEDDLIDFAVDNEITVLVLYGVDQIFRSANQNSTGQTYRSALNNFILKCSQEGILCSMVSGYTEQEYDSAAQYNKHAEAQFYNYNSAGKLTYFMIEHEFWNAKRTTSSIHTEYDSLTGDVLLDTNYTWNQHYIDCMIDHTNILNQLQDIKYEDANIWGIHDYFSYFYNYTYDTTANIYNRSNFTFRDSLAGAFEGLSDGIFLTYYEPYQWDSAIVFLGGNHQNGFVELWKERISFLGQNSTNHTQIFPLFSAEYFVNGVDSFCGINETTDFLGKYLGGPPHYLGNANHSFRHVETIYAKQHDTLFNQTNTYPNIQNIEVNAMAWWKYSCIKEKNYSNKSRIACYPFSQHPLSLFEYETSSEKSNPILFPNPTQNQVTIDLRGNPITTIYIYSINGNLIKEINGIDTTNPLQLNLEDFSNGVYFIRLAANDYSFTHKLILVK